MVYEPAEDSYLLQSVVKKKAQGSVLDIGTGSGIQAFTAASKKGVKCVVAVDIDAAALKYARVHNKHAKITHKKSDLFSAVTGKFDTIIFNAPYLPKDKRIEDPALYGGPQGHEIIERFLDDAHRYLSSQGNILLVFSSFTGKTKVEQLIAEHLFTWKEVAKKHIFYEDIFVYELKRSAVAEQLMKKNVKDVMFFDRGKRGLIFIGKFRGKKVAIKVKNPHSAAEGTVGKEVRWLKQANKHNIGAKYLFHARNYLVYEFVEGTFLKEWLPDASLRNTKLVLKKLFEQAYTLDKARINKKEMMRPYTNALVKGTNVTLIDFERAQQAKKPHNVTQLTQFVRNWRAVLQKKGIVVDTRMLQKSAKDYSVSPSKQTYLAILKTVGIS